VPRIQRFAHTVQRLAYVNFFKPEQRDDRRPDDVLARDGQPVSASAAWSATSYSEFVPYRNPSVR
jgi:hypothetical protein